MSQPDATRVSEQLFGRGCRLAVALWALVHEKGRFYQSEPPKFGSTTPSNIREELARLVELGMLDVERPPDTKKVYYVRTRSPLWRIVAEAAAVVGLKWVDDKPVETVPYEWTGWPCD
jgi:hypothetical protein